MAIVQAAANSSGMFRNSNAQVFGRDLRTARPEIETTNRRFTDLQGLDKRRRYYEGICLASLVDCSSLERDGTRSFPICLGEGRRGESKIR
jgi:hypothetical protein